MILASCYQNIKKWSLHELHKRCRFLEIHYTYIGVMSFIISGFFYFQPGNNWKYIDALFFGTSSITSTGLTTIDMSNLSLYQLLLLFFGSILGSQVTVSFVIVLVRKHFFSKRFQDILLFNRAQRLREINQRLFNKNMADVHYKMKQEEQQEQQQNNRGILSCLRSSITIACSRLFHFHLFKSPSKNHQKAIALHNAIIAEKQKIYEHLQILREKQDKEKKADDTCAGTYGENNRLNRSRTLSVTTAPTLQRLGSPKSSIAKTTGYNTKPNSIILQQVSSAPAAPQSNILSEVGSGTASIGFTSNIDRQQNYAREEFNHDRPYSELLDRIAGGGHTGSPLQDVDDEDFIAHAAENERKEINDILSGPILKHELTRKQRYHIGGVEYRAIDFLSKFIPIMYFTTNILFTFAIRIYIAADNYAQEVLKTSNANGPINPWFFSFYLAFSAYNNLGLIPMSASLEPFVNSPAPILLVSILIVVGNVGYAIVLRLYIWCIYKLLPHSRHMDRETLRYLLHHPRRCYTSMFRSTQTWWLVFVMIAFNVVEVTVFLATNYWLPILNGIPWGSRVLVGYFQGVATRNAGFTAISILRLNPGTLIIYIIAMYVSVYPVGISIRNSNEYQERELGIYSASTRTGRHYEEINISKLTRYPSMASVVSRTKKLISMRPSFYVMTQLQRMVTYEILWVALGIFCICIIEAQAIMTPTPITTLTVMYEAVSAFGNVGSSTGYPGVNTSQCGNYRTLSKLVIIVLMYRGRHRGLPSTIDHAVLLPSEKLDEKEISEHKLREKHGEILAEEKLDYQTVKWRSNAYSLV
ncbi:cation transport protein-domain-containing protein [Circinella umbellata]|nr:cation transport protein-domain-containing protein [Circinella umbellata]